jgi:hypothetical protein
MYKRSHLSDASESTLEKEGFEGYVTVPALKEGGERNGTAPLSKIHVIPQAWTDAAHHTPYSALLAVQRQ